MPFCFYYIYGYFSLAWLPWERISKKMLYCLQEVKERRSSLTPSPQPKICKNSTCENASVKHKKWDNDFCSSKRVVQHCQYVLYTYCTLFNIYANLTLKWQRFEPNSLLHILYFHYRSEPDRHFFNFYVV